jgi:HK97 family phage major capsid protein
VSDEIEKVELAEDAIDQIAERVAGLLSKTETVEVTVQDDSEIASLKAEVADLKASLTKPQRSELGDEPTKAGDEPVFYGGDDKYTSVGDNDADIATNLYIVKTVLEGSKSGERLSGRGREVMVKAAERALKAGLAPIDTKGWNPATATAFKADRAAYRAEARAKAMTSTGASAGDEWVPTFASSELWTDIHLATTIAAQIRRVNMPTNPFDLPTLDGDVTFYYASTENVAVTGSNPNTGKATLTARKIQADVDFSGETTEDSIIAVAPTVRANLVRRGAQTIDDLIVHGDTETGGTGNVNSDDGAPAAGSFYLALDGLRKFALVTNSGQAKDYNGAFSTTLFLNQRALLGKYGARPSDLLLITGVSTTNSIQDNASFKTLDVYGAQATVLTGEVGRVFGIPVFLSEAVPGTNTDKVDDDGKYTTTTPSSNDTDGWIVLVNKTQWTQGFRRDFQLESDRNIKTDTNTLVASFRMALIPSGIDTAHTSIGYNIAVL